MYSLFEGFILIVKHHRCALFHLKYFETNTKVVRLMINNKIYLLRWRFYVNRQIVNCQFEKYRVFIEVFYILEG